MEVVKKEAKTNTVIVSLNKPEVHKFSVNSDASLMNLLSQGLYNNPLKSMLQETICNAWDSHVTSNITDTPIEITITQSLGIIIKDKGKGISPDSIASTYCTYGGTTKVKDKNLIGGFGLGCKSPLAYADTFMVTSNYEGTKHIYNINRVGQEGVPTATLVSSTPTTDTGLEVLVDLKENDEITAIKHCKEILDLSGMFVNASFNEFNPVNYVGIPSGTYQIIDKANNSSFTNSHYVYAICAGVKYPIDLNLPQFSDVLENNLVINIVYLFSNSRLIIDFPPNSITPLPSREGLNMNDSTVDIIKKRLKEIDTEVVKSLPIAIQAVNQQFLDNLSKKYDSEFTIFCKAYDVSRECYQSYNLPNLMVDYTTNDFHPVALSVLSKISNYRIGNIESVQTLKLYMYTDMLKKLSKKYKNYSKICLQLMLTINRDKSIDNLYKAKYATCDLHYNAVTKPVFEKLNSIINTLPKNYKFNIYVYHGKNNYEMIDSSQLINKYNTLYKNSKSTTIVSDKVQYQNNTVIDFDWINTDRIYVGTRVHHVAQEIFNITKRDYYEDKPYIFIIAGPKKDGYAALIGGLKNHNVNTHIIENPDYDYTYKKSSYVKKTIKEECMFITIDGLTKPNMGAVTSPEKDLSIEYADAYYYSTYTELNKNEYEIRKVLNIICSSTGLKDIAYISTKNQIGTVQKYNIPDISTWLINWYKELPLTKLQLKLLFALADDQVELIKYGSYPTVNYLRLIKYPHIDKIKDYIKVFKFIRSVTKNSSYYARANPLYEFCKFLMQEKDKQTYPDSIKKCNVIASSLNKVFQFDYLNRLTKDDNNLSESQLASQYNQMRKYIK